MGALWSRELAPERPGCSGEELAESWLTGAVTIGDSVPPALAKAFAAKSLAPFAGLPLPLESTRLIIRHTSGDLVMAWTSRGEWSLAGGISKSIAPGDSRFTDFRPPVDPRYVRNGAQLPPAEQGRVIVESPLAGLRRELVEELTTGDAQVIAPASYPIDGMAQFDWLLDRVRDGRWTGVVAAKAGDGVARFETHVCFCCIELDDAAVAALNFEATAFPARELLRFERRSWARRERVESGRRVVSIDVDLPAGERLRHYDRAIVFGVYGADVLGILD